MSVSTEPSFLWANDYIALPDTKEEWILEDVLPAGGLANFYGKPKTGKSFAALGLGLAVSSGQPSWLGFDIKQHGPVAYLQIDTPRGEWKSRLRKLNHHGYNISQMAVIDMDMAPYPYNVLLPQHQAFLRHTLAQIRPVLVFVDTLREAHEGDENNSTDMKKVVNMLRSLARPAAMVLLSHSRKDSAHTVVSGGDLMDDARGSSYLAGRMDSVVKFSSKMVMLQGRSIEAKKIDTLQDPDTQLVVRKNDHSGREKIVLDVIRELQHKSVNAMAKEVVKRTGMSMSTATRDIKLLTGAVDD